MDKTKYWVWLSTRLKGNNMNITSLLEFYNDIEEIYLDNDYTHIPELDAKVKKELQNKSLDDIEKIFAKTNEAGARIVTIESDEYPPSLRNIPEPPYILYMKGLELKWDSLFTIGVIGSRRCSEYGISACRHICLPLARQGATIVSGMARGIDSVSASSALKAGGLTVAVLGCGIDVIYPAENAELEKEIEKHGVVITEYPPGSSPLPVHFPYRNRIISGLSEAMLVIEAEERSGTFSTVRSAREIGKSIYAIPGGIFHKQSAGTNIMIKEGASLITSASDIINDFSYRFNEITNEHNEPENNDASQYADMSEELPQRNVNLDDYKELNDNERLIIQLLAECNLHIDELCLKSGLDIRTLNGMLPILEIMGHITKLPGNIYKLL